MAFKDDVLMIRAKLNLTQVELAELLHVSVLSIYRWENGKNEPRRKDKYNLYDLAKKNNIDLGEM